MTTAANAWQALADWQPQTLSDLVLADPAARLQALVRSVADIRFDFAKTHLDAPAIAILNRLAEAQDFAGRRRTLFSGGIANPSEDRAAEPDQERDRPLHPQLQRDDDRRLGDRMDLQARPADLSRRPGDLGDEPDIGELGHHRADRAPVEAGEGDEVRPRRCAALVQAAQQAHPVVPSEVVQGRCATTGHDGRRP